MRLLLASGDHALARGVAECLAVDEVVTLGTSDPAGGAEDTAASWGGVTGVDLGGLTEPGAFAVVDRLAPRAVVLVPDWTRDGTDQIRGCWWLARAADLAGATTVLVSCAEVFDAADPRPRDEFAVASPQTPVGERAFAAEQVVQRSASTAVVVRVGPTDVGDRAFGRMLVGSGGGAPASDDAVVTPVAAAELGRVLRALTAGRRPGIFHVAGDGVTVADAAARLGIGRPPGGFRSVPPPLASVLCPMLDIAPPAAWPDTRPASDTAAVTR